MHLPGIAKSEAEHLKITRETIEYVVSLLLKARGQRQKQLKYSFVAGGSLLLQTNDQQWSSPPRVRKEQRTFWNTVTKCHSAFWSQTKNESVKDFFSKTLRNKHSNCHQSFVTGYLRNSARVLLATAESVAWYTLNEQPLSQPIGGGGFKRT